MQVGPLQLFNAAVAPNKRASGQIVSVRCSLPVYATTDAALPVRGFPMENAILMQDLFPAIRLAPAGVGRRPYLFPEHTERGRYEVELLLIRFRP
jgi:hypothetical protein